MSAHPVELVGVEKLVRKQASIADPPTPHMGIGD
jgi:hypothetical protein